MAAIIKAQLMCNAMFILRQELIFNVYFSCWVAYENNYIWFFMVPVLLVFVVSASSPCPQEEVGKMWINFLTAKDEKFRF